MNTLRQVWQVYDEILKLPAAGKRPQQQGTLFSTPLRGVNSDSELREMNPKGHKRSLFLFTPRAE